MGPRAERLETGGRTTLGSTRAPFIPALALFAASPVTAGKALYTNLREIDDSGWVRIVFPVPGYAWILGVQIGGGAIREIAGQLFSLAGSLLPQLGMR
jgi:hypothetical protein